MARLLLYTSSSIGRTAGTALQLAGSSLGLRRLLLPLPLF